MCSALAIPPPLFFSRSPFPLLPPARSFLRSIFRYDERCFRTRSHPCEQASELQGVSNACLFVAQMAALGLESWQAFSCKIPKPKKRSVLGDPACGEICGLRPAAMRWGQHTQRGEAAERGKAKYPSILGGRETRSRDKGARAGGVASGRIGSYAYGDRVMSCRHARSPIPQTHLQSCALTRGEK